jgi:methyl-accepting chemotaxis protein
MAEIVNPVKRVTDLIGDITTAALEQPSGIEQINTPVTDHAGRLAESVAVFRVSREETLRAIAHAHMSAGAVM